MTDREAFYAGFTPLEVAPPEPPKPRPFRVFLFRAPGYIRGWFAYVARDHGHCTVEVEVEALTSAKAKNAAITAANKNFEGCKVIRVNRTPGDHWDAGRFPELKDLKPTP